MKRLILFLLLPVFVSAQSGWNMNLLGSFDYDTNHNTKCNDIWGVFGCSWRVLSQFATVVFFSKFYSV